MTPFSPSTATMTTGRSMIPRSPPEVVTFRYQQEQMGHQMAYVSLAGSHEEAQDIAARSFPSLATVDPRCLGFTITIRYKSTNERKEINVSPEAWFYVTSKLSPYRVIDVHVVPPSFLPRSSATTAHSPLYHDSSPSKSHAPLYPEDSPAKSYAPPYTDSPAKGYAPPYPDSPPPQYPGSPKKKQLHPHLPPAGHGYGYGFGWEDQTHDQTAHDYNEPRGYNEPQLDPPEMADRRSMGWSGSSVKIQGQGWGGGGLFSRFKQNGFGIFPITWEQPRERAPRRRRHSHKESRRDRVRLDDYEPEHDNINRSGSGRSYVPSLI